MAPHPQQTIIPLSRSYPNRHGFPLIDQVDAAIFTATYCCDCADPSCADACCAYGVCVDTENRQRLLDHAEELERYLGVDRRDWFDDSCVSDAEFPGGSYTRTRVVDGGCVFLNRSSRGCRLHTYCLATGRDYHLHKPMLCSLFPVTIDGGLLRPSSEILDGSLVCRERGTTLYHGTRNELRYYYGDALIAELDLLATSSPM